MSLSPDETDFSLMRRAIRLAMRGRGRVEPNPMVGCVIARGGRVIGEGFHRQFGGPHAEPEALAACAAEGGSAEGATVYVTLEPCCHTDKKTPPCVPRLVESKVGRVVVGCVDPNPRVSGRGLARLREAGIETTEGVLEAEAKQLIAPFMARVGHGRPYVTLKWAQSADARIAGPGGRRTQISNADSSREVHQLRGRSDAILVGVNTVINDDPLLTVRRVEPLRPARRVVLDTHLRIPPDCRVIGAADKGALIVYTTVAPSAQTSALRARGVQVRPVPQDAAGRVSLRHVLASMGDDVTHLMVEPGPTLAASFFQESLADRVWVFRSPCRVEDDTAPAATAVPADYVATGEVELDGDRLTEYHNPHSEVFFGPFPSADLVRATEGRGSAGSGI